MRKCTFCQNGLYRWVIDVNTVTCVETCPEGMFESLNVDGITLECQDCLTDCLECSSDTTCDYCIIGKVSQFNGTHDECIDQCLSNFYEDEDGKCQTCPTNCATCTSDEICTSCDSGYVLNGTECITTASCTGNYYLLSTYCLECPSE